MILATSTNILCERDDGKPIAMEQSIEACANAGFRYLDYGFAELGFLSEEFHTDSWEHSIKLHKRLADQRGVTFAQGHATIFDFCNPMADVSHQLEMLHRSVRGAATLGIPWLVVHPSTHLEQGAMQPDTHEENIRFFRALSDYAHAYNVGIAIENMWGFADKDVPRYAIRAEELCALVDDIGCDNVGACWDVEHASIEQLPQGDSIRMLGGRIKATHISDETGANNIHVLPYTGFVKWGEVMQAFADIGYQNAFSLEVQHYLPSMPLELCPEAMHLAYSVGCQLVGSCGVAGGDND